MGYLKTRDLCVLADVHGMTVPPDLVVSIIQEESGGQPTIESDDGAVGLMQIVKRYHPNYDLKDPATNIKIGCRTLTRFYKFVNDGRHPNDWENESLVRRALAAYVMGPHNVAPYPDEGRWSDAVKRYCDNIWSLYQSRRYCDDQCDDR